MRLETGPKTPSRRWNQAHSPGVGSIPSNCLWCQFDSIEVAVPAKLAQPVASIIWILGRKESLLVPVLTPTLCLCRLGTGWLTSHTYCWDSHNDTTVKAEGLLWRSSRPIWGEKKKALPRRANEMAAESASYEAEESTRTTTRKILMIASAVRIAAQLVTLLPVPG